MAKKAKGRKSFMESVDTTKVSGNVGGAAATVAGAKIIERAVPEKYSKNAKLISGLGAAGGGAGIWYMAKSAFWKAFGVGMFTGGSYVAADAALSESVDKALDKAANLLPSADANDTQLTSAQLNAALAAAAATQAANNTETIYI